MARLDAGRLAPRDEREAMGQFLTPAPTARFMASLLRLEGVQVRALDPGAGVGALSAALAERFCEQAGGRTLRLVAYESDATVLPLLADTLAACVGACEAAGGCATTDLRAEDFIAAAADGLFTDDAGTFDCAILNPPYGKVRRGSTVDGALRAAGVDCTNLYTAFLLLTARLLRPGGELVAIVPRSFCNGPYFRAFRRAFLTSMTFTNMHVFTARDATFRDDAVLQETVIFRAVKCAARGAVVVSASAGCDDTDMTSREIPHDELVLPGDRDSFVRIPADGLDAGVARRMAAFTHTLADLGLSVSTGPVVDFRLRPHLRKQATKGTVPLLYPMNLRSGGVAWPDAGGRKPQAIVECEATRAALVPIGTYVLVKRFSAKEERRRIVAAVLRPEDAPGEFVGLENHVNYFHRDGGSLQTMEAYGLAAFLGSSLVDQYFRQFNGHTQVNATDLRSMRYPSATELVSLGRRARSVLGEQERLDAVVAETLFPNNDATHEVDPVKAKRRVAEACSILKALGFPAEQYNERSGLVLLALLGLDGRTPWADAQAPLVGITPMMEHMARHFGKTYAPNSRETVRRQTVHQFVQAGFILLNPDDPTRAVNSALTVYRVTDEALALLRKYGTPQWDAALAEYMRVAGTLRDKYARERDMARIAVKVAEGTTVALTPGGQNVLVEQVINQFLPRFTPGCRLVYVGDTGKKWAYFDAGLLKSLGVEVDPHGQFPDVIAFYEAERWLVLIEAVTAHGPVDAKRHMELRELFAGATVGLVYVTAFLDRATFVRYARDVAWETEVWSADAPDHLIHFDGQRFLGPYEPREREG